MKVLLVDDHTLFREGLAMLVAQGLPQVELLQADDMAQALRHVASHPELRLVLLDLALPDFTGLDALRHLRSHAPHLKVVVVSSDDAPATVLSAIDAGAAGFIPKTSRSGVMLAALRDVLDGAVFLPPNLLRPGTDDSAAIAAAFEPASRSSDVADGLTPRQGEVLRLLVEGRSNKAIGRELGLSESTVKTHLASIYARLGVTSRTQAVVAAARLGVRLGPHAPA